MVVLTNFPPPTEGVRHKQVNTKAVIGQLELGNGVLYIAESQLSWVSENGQGFSLEYPAVSLHAISRALDSYPAECLYLMVEADFSAGKRRDGTKEALKVADDMADCSLNINTAEGRTPQPIQPTGFFGEAERAAEDTDEQSNDEEDSVDAITEIRFVPEEKQALDLMFDVMSDCQAMHPDENDSFSEGDEYPDAVAMGDDEDQLPGLANGHGSNGHGRQNLDDCEQMDEGQFDDA